MKYSQMLHEKVSNNESIFHDDLMSLHNQLNEDLKLLQQNINMAISSQGTQKEKQSTLEPSKEGSKPSSLTNIVDKNISTNSHKLETSEDRLDSIKEQSLEVTKNKPNNNEIIDKNNMQHNINRIDTSNASISNNTSLSHQEGAQIIHLSTDNTTSTSNVESRKTTKKRKRNRAKNRSTENTRKRRKHFSLMQRFSLTQYLNTTLKIRSLNDPNLRCSLKLNLVSSAKEILETGKDDLKFEYMIEDVKTFVKIVFNHYKQIDDIITANNRNEFPVMLVPEVNEIATGTENV